MEKGEGENARHQWDVCSEDRQRSFICTKVDGLLLAEQGSAAQQRGFHEPVTRCHKTDNRASTQSPLKHAIITS